MYYLDDGQRSYKLHTKHADRMILPNSSQKTLSAQEWRNRQLKKSDFVIFFLLLSHTKLLTSIAYKLKQLLSYFTQNNIAFIVVAPFSLFVCKLARVAVLASCGFATF